MNLEFWLDSELHRCLDDELLFWLLVDILAELGYKENKWTKQVLVNPHHSIETSILKHGTHHALKDITKDLWRFEWLNLVLIETKISLDKGEIEVVIHILL